MTTAMKAIATIVIITRATMTNKVKKTVKMEILKNRFQTSI